uniref:BAH domain-containing protein n=1 Tax=Trichogramma kaykai TaxID=54128 RepID=A0ABD2VZJ8_9HYME
MYLEPLDFYRTYCPQYYSTPPQYQELCYPPSYPPHTHPHPPPYYKYAPPYRRGYYGYQESGAGPGGPGASGAVEYQPPPGEYLYYGGYPPPPPPPPLPNPAYMPGRPFVDHTFQGCPCPMQSCPKNADTGPLIGNGKGAPVAQQGPGLSLPPSALVGPPSPARGLAGLAPPHGANAWDTDRLQKQHNSGSAGSGSHTATARSSSHQQQQQQQQQQLQLQLQQDQQQQQQQQQKLQLLQQKKQQQHVSATSSFSTIDYSKSMTTTTTLTSTISAAAATAATSRTVKTAECEEGNTCKERALQKQCICSLRQSPSKMKRHATIDEMGSSPGSVVGSSATRIACEVKIEQSVSPASDSVGSTTCEPEASSTPMKLHHHQPHNHPQHHHPHHHHHHHGLNIENNNVKCEACSSGSVSDQTELESESQHHHHAQTPMVCRVKCETGCGGCDILKCEQCIKESGQLSNSEIDKDSGILEDDAGCGKMEIDTEVKEELNALTDSGEWQKPDYEAEASDLGLSKSEDTMQLTSSTDNSFSQNNDSIDKESLKKKSSKKVAQKRKIESSNKFEAAAKKLKIKTASEIEKCASSYEETINFVAQQCSVKKPKTSKKTLKNATAVTKSKKLTNVKTDDKIKPKAQKNSKKTAEPKNAKNQPSVSTSKPVAVFKSLEIKVNNVKAVDAKINDGKKQNSTNTSSSDSNLLPNPIKLVKLKNGLKKSSESLVVPDTAAKKNAKCKSKVQKKNRKDSEETAVTAKEHSSEVVDSNKSLELPRRLSFKPKWSNGWSWEGEPFEATVDLTNEHSVTRICYARMRHQSGDVLQPKDCVLLKSGPRKADLPYVAKIAALWENPEDGEMMFSLLWYYRPEHTEQGRTKYDYDEEVFASKHRDVNSVACIEDKCYVLTETEYGRYRKNLRKTEEGIEGPCLTSLVVPPSTEAYPRVSRQPPNPVPHDLVLFCRNVYDYRLKKIIREHKYTRNHHTKRLRRRTKSASPHSAADSAEAKTHKKKKINER